LLPNLAKSSYGRSTLWLHHKIEKRTKNNDIKNTYSTPMPMHITHTRMRVAHIVLSRTVAQQKKTHDRLTIFEIEALDESFQTPSS
jgi:hypothetical protein